MAYGRAWARPLQWPTDYKGLSGNVDGNPGEIYYRFGSKQPCESQFRDNIQLEVSYKAFMDGTGKCGKGPSLLEKQDKATREQISRARQLEEDLIREDLCDADHISALNSKTKMHM